MDEFHSEWIDLSAHEKARGERVAILSRGDLARADHTRYCAASGGGLGN